MSGEGGAFGQWVRRQFFWRELTGMGGDFLKYAAFAGLAGAISIAVWALSILSDAEAIHDAFGDWPHVPDEGRSA